jgi:type II secretory pathway component HofQ
VKRDEKSVRWKSKVCRRAVVDHTFFCTAEQDELKTLLRNFALYTAVNLKAEVHIAELLRINLDEMWSDKFPIGIPI